MKKILFYLAFIATIAAGCTKEEPKTTYSFIATDGAVSSMLESLNSNNYYNSSFEVIFSEYSGGHRISHQSVDNVLDDKKYTFEANPSTEYVTVRIDVTAEHDRYEDYDFTRFISNVFLIEKGKNTEIIFTPETYVSKSEPK